MRKLAALGFVALSGAALVVKLSTAFRPELTPPPVFAYVTNFQMPFALARPLKLVDPHFVPLTSEITTAAPPVQASSEPALRQLSVVIAGDTGLNGSFQPVYASFGMKHGARMAFSDATQNIAPLINGDINFANLETVVTDRNDLSASLKMFGFRTHPEAVRELLRVGFNVFSTANNHSMDYGLEGARETLVQLDKLGVAHVGIGLSRTEAAQARLIERHGVRLAFGALGIGGSGFGSIRRDDVAPGQLTVSDGDLAEVAQSLAGSQSDYRIMSVHYGTEFEVRTSNTDRQRFSRVLSSGVDMVVGHHHHVAAGVELVDGKPIFYGLGNFLHWGTQDMGRHDMCHDYGLVARVHLAGRADEKLSVKAIEALPIKDMHIRPRQLVGEEAAARVHALNYLGRQLGPSGVQFSVQADGTGLFCASGSETLKGDIGARCKARIEFKAPAAALASKISDACSRRVVRIVEETPEAETMQVSFNGSSVSENALVE